MKKRLITLVIGLLVLVVINQAYGYKLFKHYKNIGNGYYENIFYYRCKSNDEVRDLYLKLLDSIGNGKNYFYIWNAQKRRIAVLNKWRMKMAKLTLVDAWRPQYDVGVLYAYMKIVKNYKVRYVGYLPNKRGGYYWRVYIPERRKPIEGITLHKGNDLLAWYIAKKVSQGTVSPMSVVLSKEAFLMLSTPRNGHWARMYMYSKYYPKLDITLTLGFCPKYLTLDAFDKVIADAKKRGIILK